ncbi:hypothetical protein PHSC3_000226 [Chlamydiales bacterium STE3]|nr:hypothetical protein PHSC3_000226 [Chlamydiales bacterium STE3]
MPNIADVKLETNDSLVLTPLPKHRSCNLQVIAIVALEVLLSVAATAIGAAAMISGVAVVWTGLIPCALLMIGIFLGALCCLKPAQKNDWTFKRQASDPRCIISQRNDWQKKGRGQVALWDA